MIQQDFIPFCTRTFLVSWTSTIFGQHQEQKRKISLYEVSWIELSVLLHKSRQRAYLEQMICRWWKVNSNSVGQTRLCHSCTPSIISMITRVSHCPGDCLRFILLLCFGVTKLSSFHCACQIKCSMHLVSCALQTLPLQSSVMYILRSDFVYSFLSGFLASCSLFLDLNSLAPCSTTP